MSQQYSRTARGIRIQHSGVTGIPGGDLLTSRGSMRAMVPAKRHHLLRTGRRKPVTPLNGYGTL